MNYIAVYGTLRRGASAERFMHGLVKYEGECKIPGVLYHLGSFPGVTKGDGAVKADLYSFDHSVKDKLFTILDRYEGYREDDPSASLFVRTQTMLLQPNGISAWVYHFNMDITHGKVIKSGDWFHKEV